MNLLGRRSLSSFFRVLLDFAFYAACLVGALDAIIATVLRFRGTARQSDDMTMMLVTREGAA